MDLFACPLAWNELTRSATCLWRDLDLGLPGSDAVCCSPKPIVVGWAKAVIVDVWVEAWPGAGDDGREGRLRMGRARRVFILTTSATCRVTRTKGVET